jgi:4-alpha-glucanotransferase
VRPYIELRGQLLAGKLQLRGLRIRHIMESARDWVVPYKVHTTKSHSITRRHRVGTIPT